jgi:hypothetical protein
VCAKDADAGRAIGGEGAQARLVGDARRLVDGDEALKGA